MSYQSKPAAPATVTANRDAVALYDMANRHDFADVERGYLAPLPDQVVNVHGQVVFDARRFDFIGQQDAAPDAVNPSLWRQAQLITKAGLFKVVDGLYQVRNNDTGNLTIIDGPTGLVIIDCMTAIEPAQQGLALFREYVSDKPIVAII